MIRMTFPKALLISFLWHLFCLFAVVIIVSPVGIGREKFSKISFIGAILDKDTSDYYRQKKGFSQPAGEHLAEQLSGGNDMAITFIEERPGVAGGRSYVGKPYADSITEIIKEKKDLPADVPLQIEKIGLVHSTDIESEAAGRQVLFKPPTPVISRAFQAGKTPSKGEKFQIKLRFLVSPEGKVVFIEKMKSCGYPDIDLIAVRYIKKWQFAPLNPAKSKKNQEGIMLLELEAQ